ncbi:MAG: DUF3352 domain-containing protein [Phycisphaerae bacterium]|nr:DUF3352 domain-containing protein [Phycisphaerae bacterium]
MDYRTDDNHTKRKFNISLILLCCCAAVLGFSASARAKALPRTDKLLPPETVLLINIDNFQQLKTQFEKTCLYKFYTDPAMAAFAGNTKTKWREKIQKLDDNDIFKAILNADVQPQGKVAVALVLDQQTKDANVPPLVIITQWGKGIDKIKEAVDKMLKKNIELGGHRKKSENYRGVNIEITIDEGASELNHCFIDDSLIAATNLDLLKFVIAHIKGSGSPALADDDDYNAVMKTVGPRHDIDFYINIKQFLKIILAEDPDGKVRQWTANMGLDNITALGCSTAVAENPGSSFSAKAFLKINGGKKGICKILDMESAAFEAPPFVPASTYSITFFNLNIKKAYDELYSILYSFNPQYVMMLQSLDLPDSPDGQPGLKFKSDVINYLGSQIVFAQSANKPFSNNSMPSDALLAIAVNDRKALEKSLSLLHSKMLAANNPDARRELLGHTIYLLGPSALPFLRPGMTPMSAPGPSRLGVEPRSDETSPVGGQDLSESNTPQTTTMAFTVTDTHLVFASESAVEQAIRTLSSTDAAPVGSAKWFTSAKSVIPSAVGMTALENNAASSEIFWWMAKQSSNAKSPDGSALMKFGPAIIGELFNFDLLPEFEVVRKYFGMSAFYGISKPEGFFFEFRNISPAEPVN